MSFYGLVAIGPLEYADVLPSGLGVYVGRASRAVWKYDGTTWTSYTVSTMGSAELVEAIAVAQSDPNVVYVLGEDASNNFKVHRSINGGVDWSLAALPVAQGEMRQATSIWAPDAGTVFMSFCCTSTAAMIWRSTDGGTSWHKIAAGLTSGLGNTQYGNQVGRMGFSQTKIWIGGDQTDTGTGINSTNAFHRYDADGANAVHVAFDNEYYTTPSMAAAPDRDDRAWVYWGAEGPDGSGLRKVTPSTSTGAGLHGDWTSDGLSAVLDLGGATATVVVVAHIGGTTADWALYQSTNDGASWTKVTATSADFRLPVGSEYAYVLARNPNAPTTEAYYVAHTKIHKTTDGGATWTDITAGGPAGGICIAAGYS